MRNVEARYHWLPRWKLKRAPVGDNPLLLCWMDGTNSRSISLGLFVGVRTHTAVALEQGEAIPFIHGSFPGLKIIRMN